MAAVEASNTKVISFIQGIYMSIAIYSCCSHLEHRASVKRFVSLQFLNLRLSVGLLGRGISPTQGRYLTQTGNKRKQTTMHQFKFQTLAGL
jgi:hypothetical protein